MTANPAPSTAADRLARISTAISDHESYRDNCIGLVPTENRMSPRARAAMNSDLAHRYLFQNPQWRYVGGKHLAVVEETAKELARELFDAKHVNVRPLSGENCTNIVIHAVVPKGGNFYHLAMEDGGHFAAASVADRLTDNRFLLPFDRERATIDVAACAEMFASHPPDVIYLDASMTTQPHPLQELRALAGDDTVIVYDASQTLGLIAGGRFQDPLREGADILSGSTHKSLPGPQKGMVLTNRDDLIEAVERTIFPGHVSNFQVHHVAALAVTLAETLEFGREYADQIIRNARALAAELRNLGLAVQTGGGETETHQVWLDVTALATPDEAVERLHDANIIANVNLIPTMQSKGLRLGVPEVTRLGMTEDDMRAIARLMHDALAHVRPIEHVRADATRLASAHTEVRYCFPEA